DEHDPAVDIEEEIANNGVAYDSHGGLVHVLWRYFNAGGVQSYRFEPQASRFVSVWRGPVVEGEDAWLQANSLCLRPDTSTVAAWFAIADAVVAPDGGMARLGRLGLFSAGRARFLDVLTEMGRDLLVSPVGAHDEVRVGVDFYEFRPIYLDARRLLLN